MRRLAFLALTALLVSPAVAQHELHGAASPYAGEAAREIKSLSPDDIAELRRGGGWGLAKAAELNGVPGPVHLLEMQEQLGLSPDQVLAIRTVFETMRAEAVREGERLIALERALENEFRSGRVNDAGLRALLDSIEKARSRLRYVHLSAHLTTPPILSSGQLEKYAALRGYGKNPCGVVPPGHDAAIWRRHNGCK